MGAGGHVYQYPLNFGLVEMQPETLISKKKKVRVDVEEMTSFEDWLRDAVDAGDLSQVRRRSIKLEMI